MVTPVAHRIKSLGIIVLLFLAGAFFVSEGRVLASGLLAGGSSDAPGVARVETPQQKTSYRFYSNIFGSGSYAGKITNSRIFAQSQSVTAVFANSAPIAIPGASSPVNGGGLSQPLFLKHHGRRPERNDHRCKRQDQRLFAHIPKRCRDASCFPDRSKIRASVRCRRKSRCQQHHLYL